jgi:serine/threonine protein kinase
VAVTRCVDPDWPCAPRALAAARDARDLAEQALQDAAGDTTEQPVVDSVGAPIDDAEEATEADALPVDEETTTLRPPIRPDLALWEAATVSDPTHDRPARPRGRIGKYELSSRLARGAFGVVYTARDPSLDRNVAIKVLRLSHSTNQDIVQRFLQEARATARIAHPGIVTIHDFGMVETRRGSTAFIAMELLTGESLSRRLAHEGRMDPAAACEIVRQVASALEAAHHVDVLHRDLKPDNIFLVPDPAMPSGERVKVLDFGLAKLGASGHTQAQLVFGTPRYMSPEQGRSTTQIDRRSDIYSLGCILFELVTGDTPFDGDPRQLIERHQRATPPRAAALAAPGGVPPVLDELIADMLAKDPSDRPQTMAAVQRVLRFAANGDAEGPPPRHSSGRVLPLPAVEISMSSLRWRQAIEPAPPRAGDRSMSGEAMSGQAMSGQAMSGQAMSGQATSGVIVVPAAAARAAMSGQAMSGQATSGVIVVPAAAAREAERSVPAAPIGGPEAPDRRQRLVFYLCVVTVAVVTAAALAVA